MFYSLSRKRGHCYTLLVRAGKKEIAMFYSLKLAKRTLLYFTRWCWQRGLCYILIVGAGKGDFATFSRPYEIRIHICTLFCLLSA